MLDYELESLLGSPSAFKWSNEATLTTSQHIYYVWASYVGLIFCIYSVMRLLPPFRIKPVVAAHNLTLSVMSLWMLVGVSSVLMRRYQTFGFRVLMCPLEESEREADVYWWMFVFYLSKFYELFDTVLFALCKRDRQMLHPLHMFHHATVIVEVWCWLNYELELSAFGMVFNTLVHTFMYFYYFSAAVKFAPGTVIKKFITQLQILQFVCSFIPAFPYFKYWLEHADDLNGGCRGLEAWWISAVLNGIFLTLFIKFYRSTYTPEKSKST